MKLTGFNKIFGSGPVGLLISIALFFIASRLNRIIKLPAISNNQALLNSIFFISCLITLAMIIWSIRSLPAAKRGSKLCTGGAFRYFRHPLYAAFLSVFNFGLAIYLNNYIYIIWAAILHPVWHYIIRYEEKLMIDIFGEDYKNYQQKTGRFFPRLKF